MRLNERNGRRKLRSQAPQRTTKLGNYLIVTDALETEKNYFYGFRDSIPSDYRKRLVIQVKTGVEVKDIINVALNLQATSPQYRELWLVFDRDQVVNFDELISEAQQKGICVAWSNPCIEIWFSAYFGKMARCADSVSCCNSFAKTFKRRCNTEYRKNDKDIYRKLKQHGDEALAIKRSAVVLSAHKQQGNHKPSVQLGASTIHVLINDILERIGDNR